MKLSPSARRFRGRRLTVLIVVVVVLAPVAAGLGYAAARNGWGRPKFIGADTHGLLSWLGQAMIFVGLAVEIWGLVRLFRARRGSSPWDSPLLELSRDAKRGLRDQLRGRRPIDTDSLPAVRLLAQTKVREYGDFAPVLVGLMIMETGQLLIREMSAVGWLMVFSTIVLAIGLIISLVEVRRARSFLLADPEQNPDPARVR